MRYLRTGAANVIDVGPAVIGTTAGTLVSPTTGLSNATVDEVGVYKHGATSLTSTTGSALTHRAGGIYTLSLSTAHVDTVGRLTFYLRDDSACLPIRHEFMVLPGVVFDSLVAGSDNLQVGVDSIGGSTVPALLIAAQYDAMHYGGVAAGAAGSVTLSTAGSGATRTADFYQGQVAHIYSGPGAGQSRFIVSGTTALVQAVSPNWVTNPTTASAVMIFPYARAITASSVLPAVDVVALRGSTQSAIDLKDFADAGYDPATNRLTGIPTNFTALAITTAGVVSSNATVSSTAIAAGVTTSLVSHNLDHLALTATTVAPAAGTYLGRIMHASTAGTYNRTTDSLEAIRNRGDVAWTGGSTATFPANFASLVVSTAGWVRANATLIEGTDATDQLTAAVNASTAVQAIPTAPLLAASAPVNFGALSITTGGSVTAGNMRGTDNAFLAASAPTNFSSLAVTGAGAVTAGTVSDKTGYSLAATGLDAVTIAEPSAVPTWGTVNARQALAWVLAPMRNKTIQTSTEWRLRNDADNADLATRAVTATTSQITVGEPA